MRNYERIIRAVGSQPWAIEPTRGAELYAFFLMKHNGYKASPQEIDAIAEQARAGSSQTRAAGQVAVLPIRGVIAHRAEEVDDISGPGGTSTEKLGKRFDEAVADSNVSAIVFDVDSPGGAVQGVPELAAKIRAARGSKPIIAVTNAMAASAAYWLATQADELVVTPSGEVGSVGVYTMHQDLSARAEMEGIRTTFIHAGRYKVEGNPFEPLTDEAREHLQVRVNEAYDSFTGDVAAGRGVSIDTVRAGFGEGRMVKAETAIQAGMADRIATLEEVLADLRSSAQPARTGRSAAARRRRLALL